MLDDRGRVPRCALFFTKLRKDGTYPFDRTRYAPADLKLSAGPIDKFLQDRTNADSAPMLELIQAIDLVVQDLQKVVPFDPGVMNLQTAIEGNDFLIAFPGLTSAGFPWSRDFKCKAEALNDPAVLAGLEEDFIQLCTGDYSSGPWCLNLKDELRPENKKGVPRSFAGGPLDLVLFGKQLFGVFDDHLRERCYHQPIRIGMTGFHGGMERFFKIHNQRSNHWDADFSDFDGKRCLWAIAAVAAIRAKFFPLEWHPAIWAYYNCVAVQEWILPDGLVKKKNGTFPSGLWTCATDNSIYNLLLLKMAELHCSTTKDWVISVYGDDHLVSTNEQIDLNEVKKFMERCGETYTSADKNAPLQLKRLRDCTFLKMHFSETSPCYPWRESARIFAILEWCKRSTHEIRLQRMQAAMINSFGTTAYAPIRRFCEEYVSRRGGCDFLNEEELKELIMPGLESFEPIMVENF